MPTTSVWAQTASPPAPPPPGRADVVIVGGGITGVALLRHLAGGGRRVALLERAGLAAGASGRNAGFLLAGVADTYAAAVRAHGRSTARELWALTVASHARLVELAAGAPIGYRRCGSVVVAADAAESDDLALSATLLAEDGVEARLARRAEEWPGEPHGSLVVPGDGELDPAAAVAAVAAGSADPGASVHTGVSVLGVEGAEGDLRVHTDAGEVAAGVVVLAVNAWTCRLAGLGVRGVRAQMLATAPRRPAPRLGRPAYARRGLDYWRRLADGRLIVGGRRDVDAAAEVGEEDAVTGPVQAALDILRGQLGAATETVTHRWSGAMGFTADGLPLVGPIPGRPGMHVSAGYNGHGMGMAVECARLAAEAVLHGTAPPAWLAAGRPAMGSPADLATVVVADGAVPGVRPG